MPDNPISNPGPIFLGGPKFGKPLSRKETRTKKISLWLKKNGSNLVVPLIAILILVGGIYLYKNWPAESSVSIEKQIAGLSEKIGQEESPETSLTPEPTEPETPRIIPPKPIAQEPQEKQTPEITSLQGDEKITLRATKGEGITHLARRALKEYADKDSELSNQLTKEHKIFIEDYLKDKKLAERNNNALVKIDEEFSFDQNLLNEVINKSLQLSPEQLKSLQKYSNLVPSL